MARTPLSGFVVGIALVLTGSPVGGLAQPSTFSAAIHAGGCDELLEVVAPISDAVVASGDRLGHADALPAASGFATVPVSLDALVGATHAVVVEHSSEDAIAYCGEIGGFRTDTGALIFGLEPESSGGSGVVYMAPGANPAQTDVSLFFVPPADATAPAMDGDDPLSVIGQTESPVASDDQPFASGGLGLSVVEWQAHHGPGVPSGPMSMEYEDGRFDAMSGASGRIRWLHHHPEVGLSLDEARLVGLLFAPDDAALVTTYVSDVGLVVDLYYSETLQARFPDEDVWWEGEPGNFIVIYGQHGPPIGTGDVTDVLLATGNDP